jgi:hypothetical protein
MDETMLNEHIKFIEDHYKKNVHSMSSNIGWVHTGTSITSKIYESREYVATYFQDGQYVHDVTKMD